MKDLFKILLLTISLVFVSCFGDLDFDQVEDIEIEPVIVSPLVNFEFNQLDYIQVDVDNLPTITDEIVFPKLINNEGIEDDIDRVIFQFEGSNTFNGNITINVQLLDEFGNAIYVFSEMIINANDPNFYFEEEIDLLEVPNALDAHSIYGEFTYDGAIEALDPRTLTFQSAGIFYLNIN